MRVLHVTATLDPVSGGGTAERTVQVARALAAQGVRCQIMSLDDGVTPATRAAPHPVELVTLNTLSRRWFLPAPSVSPLLEQVRHADVVHLMGHWTALNALAFLAARRTRTPYVVCPAGALPVIGRSKRLKRAYNAVVGRRLVQGASAHVAITLAEAEQFAAYGIDPASVVVIPNGVPAQDAADSEDSAPEQSTPDWASLQPFVLFLGRLSYIKGPDLLVEAFGRARDRLGGHRLVLVGPDEGMGPGLRQRADDLGVGDRVHLLGPLQGAAKAAAYRGAALLAVPSRLEAMSIVALEAGASGTAVLMTDTCGFDDVVEAGGGRIAPATVAGLEEGLVAMLTGGTDLEQMGANLRKLVLADFTWERTAQRYLALYLKVTAAQRAPEVHQEATRAT